MLPEFGSQRDYWVDSMFLGGDREYLNSICYLDKLTIARRYDISGQ